jgi:methylated-DNA-[protein]-cysteine S-methyltransferase
MALRAEWTQYAVPGWGVGELWTDDGLVLSHELPFRVDAHGDPGTATQSELVGRLTAFLAGEDVSFANVRLDLGWTTPFQRAVADALREVRRGEVVSYGEVAALAGYPGAARAVGTFCAQNRFMFFVPCHRVVGASGIGGYGSAGVRVKRRLLELEGVRL